MNGLLYIITASKKMLHRRDSLEITQGWIHQNVEFPASE